LRRPRESRYSREKSFSASLCLRGKSVSVSLWLHLRVSAPLWSRFPAHAILISELQEALAKDARLQTADGDLLAIAHDRDMRPPWHRADLGNEIHVRKRSPPQSDEAGRVESPLQVLQPIGDGVALISHGCDVEQFPIGHNRGD